MCVFYLKIVRKRIVFCLSFFVSVNLFDYSENFHEISIVFFRANWLVDRSTIRVNNAKSIDSSVIFCVAQCSVASSPSAQNTRTFNLNIVQLHDPHTHNIRRSLNNNFEKRNKTLNNRGNIISNRKKCNNFHKLWLWLSVEVENNWRRFQKP